MQVSYRIKTAGMKAGYLARGMAYILRGDNIGRTKEVGQPDQNKVIQAFWHTEAKGNPPCSIFFFYISEVFGCFV